MAAAVSRLLFTISSDNTLPELGSPAADGGGTEAVGANGLYARAGGSGVLAATLGTGSDFGWDIANRRK